MFYNNFVDLCNKKKMSPSAVAEDMGYQRSVITRWASGTNPRQATLQRIAEYFGITVAELLGEEKKTATIGDSLTAEELDFIRLFSEADEQKKAAIRILLGM